MSGSELPRILVLALGRINAVDTYNNGLFLRNLLAAWPRERLAQIWSSGNTGDAGFFGAYYELAPQDRRAGDVFYRLRGREVTTQAGAAAATARDESRPPTPARRLARIVRESGIYEMIFRPRLSQELLAFVRAFDPQIILAQGYNLTYTWLPLMLREATGVPLAVLATDDWPSSLYAGQQGESRALRGIVRPAVDRAARRLFTEADSPFAFGEPMAIEYQQRYGRTMAVINHSDDPSRFEAAPPLRRHPKEILSIVVIGSFNAFRWPLLVDLDDACAELGRRGIQARVTALSAGMPVQGQKALAEARHVEVLPDPGHAALPSHLKGADVLLLAEGFDAEFVDAIRLSISTKAHLFMFSRRPIIVYAAAGTGIAGYASRQGWADVVDRRSPLRLADALQRLAQDSTHREQLVAHADEVAARMHTHAVNHQAFLHGLAWKGAPRR